MSACLSVYLVLTYIIQEMSAAKHEVDVRMVRRYALIDGNSQSIAALISYAYYGERNETSLCPALL